MIMRAKVCNCAVIAPNFVGETRAACHSAKLRLHELPLIRGYPPSREGPLMCGPPLRVPIASSRGDPRAGGVLGRHGPPLGNARGRGDPRAGSAASSEGFHSEGVIPQRLWVNRPSRNGPRAKRSGVWAESWPDLLEGGEFRRTS